MLHQAVLTQAHLREILNYNPDTGHFTWLVSSVNTKAGGRAGSKDFKGYILIGYRHRSYKAHRLAWFYMTGEWPGPSLRVDHKNGIEGDNRWANLRLATVAENARNRRRGTNNTSGHKGVSWHRGKDRWQANIQINSKLLYLGAFSSKRAAIEAYRCAAEKLHGEFARVE
jgi:hypothetical protein